ncbi:hypothetical protein BpHYR1_047886 [Brachionus plicatilis]|uniref:Uncharacterized protein n=1 Tax=Brachionus plicatilis TaxID=10195 RepID=A0A3M7T8L5_BRAPC|nr:hypothetical protein BpHYR1_047886 [Brachionus plicatilis]
MKNKIINEFFVLTLKPRIFLLYNLGNSRVCPNGLRLRGNIIEALFLSLMFFQKTSGKNNRSGLTFLDVLFLNNSPENSKRKILKNDSRNFKSNRTNTSSPAHKRPISNFKYNSFFGLSVNRSFMDRGTSMLINFETE